MTHTSWLQRISDSSNLRVERIPFSKMDKWSFHKHTGNIIHDSGKFFSIEGMRVTINNESWEQPIINQPEVGILGIMTNEIDGVTKYLMQAKVEPGNKNTVQVAPTVQATWSNYTQVHNGKETFLLNTFLDDGAHMVKNQLESEQGARFYRKRNRNIIVRSKKTIKLPKNYRWLSVDEIYDLMQIDNAVNSEARSVLACIDFGDYSNIDGIHKQSDIISWFSKLKTEYSRTIRLMPLDLLQDWNIGSERISHKSGDFFSIIAVSVTVGGREVQQWTQPLLIQHTVGTVGFLSKRFNGVTHFLVQGRSEPGYYDIIEMGPTLLTSNIERKKLPFSDFFQDVPEEKLKFSHIFSEEGGRFYHTQNMYMVVELDDDEDIEIPENYIWMTLNQLKSFIPHFGYLNIEARSLLSCISINDAKNKKGGGVK